MKDIFNKIINKMLCLKSYIGEHTKLFTHSVKTGFTG